MKTGIITWWRNNYGSILQAYALQQVLNEFDDVEYEIISQYDKNPANAKNFFRKIRQIGFLNTLKRTFWRFMFPKLKNRTSAMQNFISKNLKVSEKSYNSENIAETNKIYDTFICGSDQIWNPKLTSLDSIYWLKFADKSKKKIAYAPSIGVEELSETEQKTVRENLSDFSGISCRELGGTKLLNSVLKDKECIKVVDPTLLVKKAVWDNISENFSDCKPYVFVYFLRCDKSARKAVEKFAKEKNLGIVTFPFLEAEYTEKYDFIFGDKKVWDASPADFVSYIRNADYVITDSFHASVFSIIYHKEFYVFPKKGKAQMQRLVSLISENGMDNRIVKCYEDISAVKPVDWQKTDLIMEKNRKSSYDYLKKSLEK